MRHLLATLALLAVSACAAGYTGNAAMDTFMHGTRGAARSFPVGDGRTGWELSCDGARGMSACYERAANTCPAGFDVLDASQVSASTAQRRATERSLLVVCR